MTTAYTSLLGLALPVTGELSGTWGDTVNNSITSLLDTSVAGTTNVSTDGDVTLTTTTGAANTARQAILLFSGARTALRTVTAPAQSKIYTVINATTGGFSVKLVGAGPTTGVTIVAGESAVCAWNGSDFVKVSNTGGSASFTNVTVTGTTTLSGLTASTALALDASKNVVSVTNTGTGNNVLSASPTLTGTIGAASLTLSTDLTLSGGTANGVAYLNGSKVVTSGSALTFDGTTLQVANGDVYVANGSGSNLSIGFKQSSAVKFRLRYDIAGDSLSLVDGSGNFCQTWAQGNTFTSFGIGGSEQMRLNSTGLGIGTSSPSQKLHVNGNIRVEGATSEILMATGSERTISASGASEATVLTFKRWNGSSYVSDVIMNGSGNLGLGVTPSAWNSDYKVLNYGSAGLLYGRVGSQEVAFGTNWYRDSAASFLYSTTGYASYYAQVSGAHSWFTAPSGTAGNAITFTQAMTLDASGNLGVGTTSAGDRLTVSGGRIRMDQDYQIVWQNAGTNRARIYGDSGNNILFENGSGNTERARIDSSGNLLVGTTSLIQGGKYSSLFDGATSNGIVLQTTLLSAGTGFIRFVNSAGTAQGEITANGTTTVVYTTSSDYRLKNTISPMTGALAKIALLKPCTYKWNFDGSDGQGFIAHELAEVCPDAVSGAKDGVDKDGNPKYQGIDTSFLVATLTAAIQEQQAIIESLKARLDAANL